MVDQLGLKLDPKLDQHFLINAEVISRAIKLANLSDSDTVVEVGAGIGNLTHELAKQAGKVIALEIDEQFKPVLSQLPENVSVKYGNGLNYMRGKGKYWKKREFNKIIANPPYSMLEPLLHNLTFTEYDACILLISKRFAYKIEKNPVFGSFFKVKQYFDVPKDNFYPVPRTNSVLVELLRLPKGLESGSLALFLRQYLYQHEQQVVRNSLREGLITYSREVEKIELTKNQARAIIAQSGISLELLEKVPDNAQIYYEVSRKFTDGFKL